MATINTDISQKVDIIIKAEDTLALVLNITDSTGAVFSLADYYVFFDIYGESEDTLIAAHNITAVNASTSQSISRDDYFNIFAGTIPANASTDKITVTAAEGKFVLNLTEQETSLTPGTYKYKVKLKKGTTIKTWMHGKFKVNG